MFLSVTTSPITLRILGQSLLISSVLYHGEEKDDHVPTSRLTRYFTAARSSLW